MQRRTYSRFDGSFEFAVGDHVPGTGSYVLLASAEGARTSRHEVKTVGQQLEVRLQALDTQARLTLERRDDGPLPQTVLWTVDGKEKSGGLTLGNLQEGLYHVKVTRGSNTLWVRDGLYVDRSTAIDLSR